MGFGIPVSTPDPLHPTAERKHEPYLMNKIAGGHEQIARLSDASMTQI
jgi:hypothetical protein